MLRILCEVPLPDAALARLHALPGAQIQTLPFHEAPWDLPQDLLRGPSILLCKLPPGNHAASDLKLIQISSVGYEHLRHLGLEKSPARVCNARGIFDTAIGEWNLAMVINLTRDLRGMIRNQEEGRWDKDGRYQQEIRGRVLGLWGYGGIGRETARLAKAFGMQVHVMTRTGVKPRLSDFTLPGTGDPEGVLPNQVFVQGQEMEFLRDLDYLILALPRTRDSDGMIGEKELQTLPRRAFVLNPARGPIIQEQALLRALREGWIAGAALDTHYAYPLPTEHPLWRMPNVIMTPHVSGADKSVDFPGRITALFTANVERFGAGLPLLNELTPREWQEA